MDRNRTIADSCQLISRFEGYSSIAYLCQAGRWTIGYGTTIYPDGTKVKEGDTCTEELAMFWLRNRLQSDYDKLERLLKVDTTTNQAVAMLSLMYNIGIGNFAESTVLRKHNESSFDEAEQAFLLWNKITKDGKKIENKGLTARRIAEMAKYRQSD